MATSHSFSVETACRVEEQPPWAHLTQSKVAEHEKSADFVAFKEWLDTEMKDCANLPDFEHEAYIDLYTLFGKCFPVYKWDFELERNEAGLQHGDNIDKKWIIL